MISTNEFLQELRSRTAACHKSLEDSQLSKVLLTEQVSVDNYKAYLISLYPFVKGFEQFVYPMLQADIKDIQLRKKAPLLAADIQNISIDPSTLPVIPNDFFAKLYPNIFAAWGGMYVIEGSTLGGQIMSKHLRKYLGVHVDKAMQYLVAYKENTGMMWKSFLTAFTNNGFNVVQQQVVIEHAIKTFDTLGEWMNSNTSQVTAQPTIII